MLPSQRRQAILAAVRAQDAASAEALARQFDVSVETIRRDLRAMHSDGLLERVYGGATRPSGRSSEGSFSARSVRNIESKRAVAALAASLIEPDDTVVIDDRHDRARSRQGTAGPPSAAVCSRNSPSRSRWPWPRRSDLDLMLCGGQIPAGRCGLLWGHTPRPSSESSTRTRRSSAPAACIRKPGADRLLPAPEVS